SRLIALDLASDTPLRRGGEYVASIAGAHPEPVDDVADGLGDQDLAGTGRGADARGEVDRPAEEIAGLADRRAEVDADADLDPGSRLRAVAPVERPLHRHRAGDGGSGGAEGESEAVALGLDDVPTVELDLLAHQNVVVLEHPV